MKTPVCLLACGGMILSATPVFAHPFHGEVHSHGLAEGWWHGLLGVDHIATACAIALLAAVTAPRRRGWVIGAYGIAAVAGATVGMGSGSSPIAHHVVAVTIAILGLGLLGVRPERLERLSFSLLAIPAASGLFAGFAHAGGLPVAATSSYLIGLLSGTAFLLAGTFGLCITVAPTMRRAAAWFVDVTVQREG